MALKISGRVVLRYFAWKTAFSRLMMAFGVTWRLGSARSFVDMIWEQSLKGQNRLNDYSAVIRKAHRF